VGVDRVRVGWPVWQREANVMLAARPPRPHPCLPPKGEPYQPGDSGHASYAITLLPGNSSHQPVRCASSSTSCRASRSVMKRLFVLSCTCTSSGWLSIRWRQPRLVSLARICGKRSANPSFVNALKLRCSRRRNQRAKRGEHGSTANGALPGADQGVSGLWSSTWSGFKSSGATNPSAVTAPRPSPTPCCAACRTT
jgi:hypothetical protein